MNIQQHAPSANAKLLFATLDDSAFTATETGDRYLLLFLVAEPAKDDDTEIHPFEMKNNKFWKIKKKLVIVIYTGG